MTEGQSHKFILELHSTTVYQSQLKVHTSAADTHYSILIFHVLPKNT